MPSNQIRTEIFGAVDRPIFILSPHLDDAVWSLGGLLEQLVVEKRDITALTIFSHSSFINGTMRPPVEATQVRKAENARTLQDLDIHDITLDYPEGLLRDAAPDAIFNDAYQPPQYLVDLLREQLNGLVPRDALLLVPAAFGDNIDHLTTRVVADGLVYDKRYYEDMPYATRDVRVDNAHDFLRQHGCRRVELPANPVMIDTHLELYESYTSQRLDHHIAQIRQYLTDKGYGIWTA